MRLRRTKTDQADANLIAAYRELEKPALWQPVSLEAIAVANKLLKQAFAIATKNQKYDQNSVLKLAS